MRTVGSTGGIHADQGVPIPERGTRLLVDTLGVIHDELVNFALEEADAGRIGAQTLPLLDRLADEITRVRVVGETRREAVASEERTSSSSVDAGAAFGGPSVVSARLGASGEESRSGQLRITTEDTGQTVHRVHFGAVSSLLAAVAASLDVARVWILVDEWSDLPLDLQPLLADLIRRSVFPVARVTVKIGAIEQRSEFSKQAGAGGYIGIEVGADAAADIDLDDFMVFGNDAEKAKDFFRELIYKHVRSLMIEAGDDPPPNANALISRAFTQQPAFAEFVRAAEGVPRDAINIAIQAAQLADDRQISINDIRTAARRWYARDKQTPVSANDTALSLLHWVIDKVIGERRARAFLLEQSEAARHPLIGALYDARVLHVVKRNIASHDRPGVRFDVFGLDYGCYVDLLATQRAPLGLFQAAAVNDSDDEQYVEVPHDDYRSIRRAILDLNEFEAATPAAESVADDLVL
jgi:hypothetical protein